MVMNTIARTYRRRQHALALIETVVALGILTAIVVPLAWGFGYEQRLCRSYYFRAIAIEIVDGEMEVLSAGEWKQFAEGVHEYRVHAAAARNLPPGQFVLTRTHRSVKLEWVPKQPSGGGLVSREVKLP